MLYAFLMFMVGVSNAYLKLTWWHVIFGLRTFFLACALAFWPTYLIPDLHTQFLTHLLQFWLVRLVNS
jgi:hypothetical protein